MFNFSFFTSPAKIIALAFFALAACLGAAPMAYEAPLPPAIVLEKPQEIAPDDDESIRLLKMLYNERLDFTKSYYKAYAGPVEGSIDLVLNSARRLLSVGMELQPKPEQTIALLQKMQELAAKMDLLMGIGKRRGEGYNPQKLREFKLEVELQLLKAKKALAKDKR
jgi:hypothetical protein